MIRFYAKKLERDLKRWHEKGWVTGEGYEAIQAELAREPKLSASAALAAIGAILLGFAAISFVAANWNAIPRIVLGRNPVEGGKRELFEAMQQVAETGVAPAEQVPSIGCSIKWRAA